MPKSNFIARTKLHKPAWAKLDSYCPYYSTGKRFRGYGISGGFPCFRDFRGFPLLPGLHPSVIFGLSSFGLSGDFRAFPASGAFRGFPASGAFPASRAFPASKIPCFQNSRLPKFSGQNKLCLVLVIFAKTGSKVKKY